MVMRGPLLTVARKAPRRDAKPLTPTRLAALLRAVAQSSAYLAQREAAREHDRWYCCHSKNDQCGTGREGTGFSPEKTLVMCNCTQVPELGPCEHQRAATAGEAS